MATLWNDDSALFALVKRHLFSAVLGDVLDQHRLHHQFLPPRLRPLGAGGVLVGRAMPVREVDGVDGGAPFGKMFEALDDLRPGEIYLAAGGTPEYALFGELMAVAAWARAANGAVLCGFHRDTERLNALAFPLFSYGPYAQDQGARGHVDAYRVPLEIGGVRVDPGDLVVGDIDGVVVVPQSVEERIVGDALAKVQAESEVRTALEAGMPAREAFDKYGVM